jgi:hypothetical protein
MPSTAATQVHQLGQVHDFAQMVLAAIGVDVLAQQVDLAHALPARWITSRSRRPLAGDLLAAGVGHHAERAVLAAALHDRHEGGGPSTFGSGRRSNFSISGKLTSTTRVCPGLFAPRAAAIISGSRCSVWGPNTMST